MSAATDRYYRPSGAVPMTGILAMLVLGGGSALVFSFLYALILMYVPYDKIIFLGTVALGCGVGGMLRGGALLGGVTSRLFVALVALVCGIIAAYFTWTWFIWMWSEWDPGWIILDPLVMFQLLQEVSVEGIRENSPTGGWLQLLWLGEALLIIGCALGIAVLEYSPYCHACRRWAAELPEKAVLPQSNVSSLQADLEEERYDVLNRLAEQSIDPLSHLELSLRKCPGCDDGTYLSVSEVTVTPHKNETNVERKERIRRLHVPPDVAEQIVAIHARQQGPQVQDLNFGTPETPPDPPEPSPPQTV